MLKSDNMMPQYHDVRTDHGDAFPFGKMLGQLPVDVRTPAKRAAWHMSAFRMLSVALIVIKGRQCAGPCSC
jgi:hypothetical protein